jgi:signal transduction histidine kinase
MMRRVLDGKEMTGLVTVDAGPGAGSSWETHYLPLDGADPDRVIALSLDVTDRITAARERERVLDEERKARAKAEEAVRARETFLSVASHELRTPLAALRLSLQMMLQPAGESGPAALARIALRQSQRLEQLVENLLDVSRLRSGKLDLALRDVDLAEVTREAAARVEDTHPGTTSRVEVRTGGPLVGRWDRSLLDQVVSNLVSNALKYGDGKPIDVDLGADGAEARLVVRDRGIGIPPGEHARIFEPFERGVSPRHYGGLGLGLYIVRGIVTALGGTVALESEPGAGTTFTVRLPLAGPTV